MNGKCFGQRIIEEVEIQEATKELYALKIIQKSNRVL
jgi:hypothetical protein